MKINHPILLSLICFLITLSGCMRDQAAEVVHVRRAKPYHIVKSGETLSSIAVKYKMQEKTLVKLNRLKAPYKLVSGQRLVVHARDSEDNTSPETIAPVDEKIRSSSISESEVSVKPLDDVGGGAMGGMAAAGATATAGMASSTSSGETSNITPKETISDPSSPSQADKNDKSAPTSTSYEWPVQGKIIQGFNEALKNGTKSDGIIISAPMNTKVKAAADGTLRSAGSKLAAYGKMIVIKHSDGKMTIYAHLNDIYVKQPPKGQIVKIKQGDVIGTVGKTGIAIQPQLYFQVRMPAPDLTPINPTDVLP